MFRLGGSLRRIDTTLSRGTEMKTVLYRLSYGLLLAFLPTKLKAGRKQLNSCCYLNRTTWSPFVKGGGRYIRFNAGYVTYYTNEAVPHRIFVSFISEIISVKSIFIKILKFCPKMSWKNGEGDTQFFERNP